MGDCGKLSKGMAYDSDSRAVAVGNRKEAVMKKLKEETSKSKKKTKRK